MEQIAKTDVIKEIFFKKFFVFFLENWHVDSYFEQIKQTQICMALSCIILPRIPQFDRSSPFVKYQKDNSKNSVSLWICSIDCRC